MIGCLLKIWTRLMVMDFDDSVVEWCLQKCPSFLSLLACKSSRMNIMQGTRFLKQNVSVQVSIHDSQPMTL